MASEAHHGGKRTVWIGLLAFLAGAGLIGVITLAPSAGETDRPWLEADCRPGLYRGGDRGMYAYVSADDVQLAVELIDPHWLKDRDDRRFVFDGDGSLIGVEADWSFLQDAMRRGPTYGGRTERIIAALRVQTRGLRVDMSRIEACHDPDRMDSRVQRFIFDASR